MGGAWSGPAPAGERFELREPQRNAYVLDADATSASGPTLQSATARGPAWIRARREGSTNTIEFSQRVVLRVTSTNDLPRLLANRPLRLARVVGPDLVVLEASDPASALREAALLATEPGVQLSHPVRRRPIKLHGRYAPRPSDPLFLEQWHLENRDTNTATPLGFDLNVRSAWAVTRGEGVLIAIGDDGVEVDHPDLVVRTKGAPHRNFVTGTANGGHQSEWQAHGTAVAGLIAATGDNRLGITGVAPQARLASWVFFDDADYVGASEEQMAEMFEYELQTVAVQNHSWGNIGPEQVALGALEDAALTKAVTQGRGGRGVVIVRAAGNERETQYDANDDGYANDPRQITVGAVRANGRATSYTTPGACVLVAAFSGDDSVILPAGGYTNYPSLATTDRVGTLGYNPGPDRPDYAFGGKGFSGTSGSTPQITGLVALILAANPELTAREVQQLLVLSSRHLDLADPDIQTNGAGLRISHNLGFGVPDAGLAVRLATSFPKRPPLTTVTVTNTTRQSIADDGLRVRITGTRVPITLESIPANPSDAPHPDDPTETLPLVDVGQALAPIAQDLHGQAALIQRGENNFVEKLQFAAAAGAAFAIVWNNVGTEERIYMGGADTQFVPIPAVFIGQNNGLALRDYLRQMPNARAQIALTKTTINLPVNQTLQCEHVRLRARFAHPRRGDVRLTLVSPSGTRSVLQHLNDDDAALTEWDYHSVLHFFEGSAGVWRVEASDEKPGVTGWLLGAELAITGVPISDLDADGLDDKWERTWFGGLGQKPGDDPDRDGWNNAQEQLLGTNPVEPVQTFALDLSRWDARLTRLSWPASTNFTYEIATAEALSQPFTSLTNLPGRFPETELFLPPDAVENRFFRVRAVPR